MAGEAEILQQQRPSSYACRVPVKKQARALLKNKCAGGALKWKGIALQELKTDC